MTYQQVLHHEHIARQQRLFPRAGGAGLLRRLPRPVAPLVPAPVPAEFTRDWLYVASVESFRRFLTADIIKAVAGYYNTSAREIISERRMAAVVRHRNVAIHLSRELTLLSLAEIGRRFGNRDHTTILHSIRKIEKDIETDRELAEEIQNIRGLLMFTALPR